MNRPIGANTRHERSLRRNIRRGRDPMRVMVLLAFAVALSPGFVRQTGRPMPLPDLPAINTANFLPAAREQIEQAYSAARLNPRSAGASGKLGMILDAYEQYESAGICYRRAHLLDPGSFEWLFYLGWIQAAQGKHQEAVLTLGAAVDMRPGYLPAELKLAESLLAIGKPEDSRALYLAITRQHPENAEAHYGLGRALASLGNRTEAAASYLKACDVFPAYGVAHYALALIYRKLGRPADADEHFALYERNKRGVPVLDDPLRRDVASLNLGWIAHIRRGAELEQAGKISEAIAEQTEALRLNPDAVQAHANLIALYGRLREYDSATEHYRAAVTLNPNQPDIHYNYGVLLLRQGKRVDAERAFQQALEINPFHAEAHNNLGLLYEEQGRLNEALQEFTAAIENQPNSRMAHFHLGRILANQDRYNEAIEHFLKTLTPEDENTPGYLYALAATYARAGNFRTALKYARAAREQAAARGQTQLLTSIERDLRILEKAVADGKKQPE